jgi:hypothetical protein
VDPDEVERLTKEREKIEQEKLDKVKNLKSSKGTEYKKTFRPSGPQEYIE